MVSRETGYRDEYPPPGGHSILGPNPPRRRRPGRRHQVRNGMLIGLGCLVVIVAIGTGLTGEKFPTSSSRSHAQRWPVSRRGARSRGPAQVQVQVSRGAGRGPSSPTGSPARRGPG